MSGAERVVVLGATGALGRRVIAELVSLGIPVTGVSRGARPVGLHDSVQWCRSDLSRPEEALQVAWSPNVISTLFIPMTADALRQVPTVSRVVAFSSTSAFTKAAASSHHDRSLAEALRAGEAAVSDLGVDLTVLRPTMIYFGPGDRNVERIVAQVRRSRVFPLIGRGEGLRQPVHADDLAHAAVKALLASSTVGRSYDLGGGEVLSFREMVARSAAANGMRARFVSVPLPLAKGALRAAGVLPAFRGIPTGALERMNQDLVFDSSSASHDFGYTARPFTPPRYGAPPEPS